MVEKTCLFDIIRHEMRDGVMHHLHGSYDELIMLLSCVIAVVASYMTWVTMNRNRRTRGINRWYKCLFDHNRDAIIAIDIDHRVIAFNPAASHISGLKLEEVEQVNIDAILSIVVKEKRERTRAWFLESSRNGRESTSYSTVIIHRDGHHVHLSLKNVPVIIDGKIMGHYIIAKDTTAEALTQRRMCLSRLQRKRASFTT